MKTVIYEDPDMCRLLWEKMWPTNHFFDLWQVRSCFHDAFENPMEFHVVEENGRAVGLLPLSWNDETQSYLFFPGETWHQKTWIEQNRLIAPNFDILGELLDSVAGTLHLRYLCGNTLLDSGIPAKLDEMGYLFFPGLFDFAFENYMLSFSGKSRKKLKTELKKLGQQKVDFRFNRKEDLEWMLGMNRGMFGDNSYFSDPRFDRSFRNLVLFMERMGMLRITTVLVGGVIAAVDIGAVWKNSYILLAGGTNPEFPGIAKLINLYHMEWACAQRMDMVDFLCGDFNWKTKFHLIPNPLYEIHLEKATSLDAGYYPERSIACA